MQKLGIGNYKLSKKAKALYTKTVLGGETVEFIKPQTFMNKSGYSVSYAKNKHKIFVDNIYVVYDDLDLRLGTYKIQKGKGPKNHKGLNSIYENLGEKDFWHIRIGVENREGSGISGEDYVLANFKKDEMFILQNTLDQVIKELSKHVGV